LFLGSGILAYWIGFSDHHPRMASYRTLHKRLAAQRRAVADAEKAAVEAERRYAAASAELKRTAERSAAAEASVDAEIGELKELARIHVAGLLGDPAATNNLTTGRSSGTGQRGGAERAVHGLFGAPVPSQNGNGHPASAD
jgi:membrane protein involved in colicin uptake